MHCRISLHDRKLVRVYSRPKAHPLFVTSLAFLPPRERHSQKRQEGSESKYSLLPAHYELVSSSADRAIRWHKGPLLKTVAQIGARAYQPSLHSRMLTNIFLLLLILASPVLISLLPHFMKWTNITVIILLVVVVAVDTMRQSYRLSLPPSTWLLAIVLLWWLSVYF